MKRITRSYFKKRFSSSREGHTQSTSLINIDDSQPSSLNVNNFSLLADVTVHTMFSAGYLKKEDVTTLSVLRDHFPYWAQRLEKKVGYEGCILATKPLFILFVNNRKAEYIMLLYFLLRPRVELFI